MKLILIRLVRIYFGLGAVFSRLGILSVWGASYSRQLRIVRFGRFDDSI
jgi:hypothetical protein